MTTIYDIARKVECAPSSVSKYITKHGYVSQTLGEKIAQAMVDLDYHYNGLARNLSNGTNNRIGVMISFLDHPYFQQLITAISMAATRSGKDVVIMPTTYDPVREKRYLEELEHNPVNSFDQHLTEIGKEAVKLVLDGEHRKNNLLVNFDVYWRL